MRMPTIRRMWTLYKRTVLQEGLGFTRRNDVQVLAQNAFYLGAQSTLQALALLLERGNYDGAHRYIERHGRQAAAMRGARPKATRH